MTTTNTTTRAERATNGLLIAIVLAYGIELHEWIIRCRYRLFEGPRRLSRHVSVESRRRLGDACRHLGGMDDALHTRWA